MQMAELEEYVVTPSDDGRSESASLRMYQALPVNQETVAAASSYLDDDE